MSLETLDRRVFYPDSAVFREGDAGGNAYLVETGMIEITKDADGDQVVLGMIGPGGIFGEMALIDNQPRMATATATEQSTCVIIPREALQERLDKVDPLLRALLRIFVANIRSQTNRWLAAGSVEEAGDADGGSLDDAREQAGVRLEALRRRNEIDERREEASEDAPGPVEAPGDISEAHDAPDEVRNASVQEEDAADEAPASTAEDALGP